MGDLAGAARSGRLPRRAHDRPAGGSRPVTLDAAWRRWLERQPQREAVPLVLVAAEGGGIRAAYWTARALDCAIDADYDSCGFVPEGDPGDPGSVFAASGVSGGSLGLVAYDAAVRGREQGNWADVRLGDDFVAATGAWMLFADLPNALIKLDFEPDRAGVLERAWQRRLGHAVAAAAGLFATYRSDNRSPLLLLNGTSVQDGCRVNTSVLDADVEEAETGKALRARDCLSMGAFAAGSSRPRAACARGDARPRRPALPGRDVRLPRRRSFGALPVGLARGARPSVRRPSSRRTWWTAATSTRPRRRRCKSSGRGSSLSSRGTTRAAAGRCVVPVLLQLDNHYKEPRNSGATGRPGSPACRC